MLEKTFAAGSRIGVLGGTFDPIHNGHLAIAEVVRATFNLDAVLFIPAGTPPHKRGERTAGEQRCQMVQLAIADKPYFQLSRMEVMRKGPSYTVETMRELHALYQDVKLYLILGADMAVDFPHWYNPAGIMELAKVVAVTRPGVGQEPLHSLVARPEYSALALVEISGIDISSTDIRQRVQQGLSITELTPPAVVNYISREKLYILR